MAGADYAHCDGEPCIMPSSKVFYDADTDVPTGTVILHPECAAALRATERGRGYEKAIEALRPVLVEHFLFSLNCDHEAKTDTPWCGCARVDLGTHSSVGEAVRAWVDHVMAVAASLVEGDGEPKITEVSP